MAEAKEYLVQRIDENTFELWLEDEVLATLTKDEAWPVMIGQVHPEDILREQEDQSTIAEDNTAE